MTTIASINDIVREICAEMMRVRGVNAFLGTNNIPYQQAVKVPFSGATEPDPDGFMTAAAPPTLVIPTSLGGRYFIHVEIIWSKFPDEVDWTRKNSHEGGFFSYLTKNDDPTQRLSSSKFTSAPVPDMNKTMQHLLWEGDLQDGDSVELWVWQGAVDDEVINNPMSSNDGTSVMVELEAFLTIRRLGVRA